MESKQHRVLMVLDSMNLGGTETHVFSLVEALQRQGCSCYIVGWNGPMSQVFAQIGCPIHYIDFMAGNLESKERKIVQDLEKFMEDEEITVVHAHQTPSGKIAAKAAKKLGISFVFTVHGMYYPQEELHFVLQNSQAVISVSNPVQDYLLNQKFTSHLIPNGVDLRTFYTASYPEFRKVHNIPENARVIVYVSRITWSKAIVCDTLLRAVKDLRKEGLSDLHVVVVGDGFQFHDIERLTKTIHHFTSHTFIHLVGNQTDVSPYYAIADLVVGTGRVALEAMACGKPVLAVGNHGFFGLVEPSVYKQAWNYYFGDHFSNQKTTRVLMAKALYHALKNTDDLKKMGEEGQEWDDS